MKILHIADLHLDSAFSGFDKSRKRKERVATYSNVVNVETVSRAKRIKLVMVRWNGIYLQISQTEPQYNRPNGFLSHIMSYI